MNSLQPPPDKVVSGNVPSEISIRQARLALLHYNLLDNVNSIINSIEGPQGNAARIEWEYATSIKRDSQLVTSIIPLLGLTEDQIDELFILASTFN